MNSPIGTIRNTRQFLLEQIRDLPVEALNQIPTGFNNNIVWHLGHLVAAQQGICYTRSGCAPTVDERYITEFKNGSRPQQLYDAEAIAAITKLLFTTLDTLEADVASGLLNNYQPWKTRYGVEINSVDDAINFMSFHEGLHYGYILSFKKLVH